jgi:hypothetical protein
LKELGDLVNWAEILERDMTTVGEAIAQIVS